MKTYIQFFIATLLLFTAAQLNGQFSSQFSNGYWTFGLNGGWSYQSSDVKNTFDGFGLGLTAGRSVIHRTGGPVSLDLRARFLYARQFGLDPIRSYDIGLNEVLNGNENLDYTNYPNDLNEPQGFVYQNHRTDLAELGLEAVLIANKLRERTGIIASVYGGIGLDWYLTRIDQADRTGTPYYNQYSAIDEFNNTRSTIKTLKNGVLDGNYETRADGFGRFGKLGIMPSLGVEFGYHLTPRFALTAGHRLTFAGNNIIDGHQWEDNQNDLYHYTAFGLQWTFPDGSTNVNGKRPEITLIEPFNNPSQTTSPSGILKARILNVNSTADITCTLNGRPINFNFDDRILYTSLRLQPGQNEVIITATNPYGKARELVVIHYQTGGVIPTPPPPPPPPPGNLRPTVQITVPASSTHRTNQSQQDIRATIRNINSKNDIQFFVNGVSIRNFIYDARNDRFSTSIDLRRGNNQVEIRASNNAGTASDQATIIREDGTSQPMPTVQITRPSTSPYNSSQQQYRLEARINNIQNKNNIDFRFNGRRIYDFDWNGQILKSNLRLTSGGNNVRITATNNQGSDTDNARINYNAPSNVNPPIVNITRPSQNSATTGQSTYQIKATLENVDSKNDISFKLNNRQVYDFTYNNGQLSKTISLTEGMNYVEITGTNEGGSASDEVRIKYQKPVQQTPKPPVVTITRPANNTQTNQSRIQIEAQIKEVSNKSDVTFLVNGRQLSGFSFNPNSGRFSASVTLKEGSNLIKIAAENKDGEDRDQVTVNYGAKRPPIVDITNPGSASTTSSTARYTVKASIKNVSSKSGVRFEVNGRSDNNFQFSSERLTATINLKAGVNTIRIKGTNNDGSDEASVQITYRPANPPTVNIQKPANNSTTQTATTQLQAKVTGMSSKSGIQVLLNNKSVNFSYANGVVRATLNLIVGTNTIKVTARNDDGNASDQVSVRYRKPAPPTPKQPPIVKFTNPGSNSTTSSTARYTIKASIKNVSSKSGVRFEVNGRSETNFQFASERFTATINLKAGVNTIRIKGTNNDGSDEASVQITYRPANPPTVNIQKPANNTTSSTKAVILQAKVTGMSSKSGIQVFLNNKSVNFSYNNGTVKANLNLRVGPNIIKVTAKNNDGDDRDQVNVAYSVPAIPKPVINIRRPQKPGQSVSSSAGILTAQILNVSSKNDIEVKLNGQVFSDFRFNSKSNMLNAKFTLKKGRNDIFIKATNSAGRATASTHIIYNTNSTGTGPLPEISLINLSQPTVNPLNPTVGTTTISLATKNVRKKNQITFTINGNPFTDFTFNAQTGQINANLVLSSGETTLVIKVVNRNGEDSITQKVNF